MPARGKACLTCKHVGFIQPSDWKPRYDGDEYQRHDVLHVIRETKQHVSARCTFNPVWIDVSTAHYCGRWDGRRIEEDAQEVIWGTWAARNNDYLSEQVKKLKARLKNSQSISARRLARLKDHGAA
jgi:hypothetical protein